MSYSTATWRVQISENSWVEISVKGCDHDRIQATPEQVMRAGKILIDVGKAAKRLQQKYPRHVLPMEQSA